MLPRPTLVLFCCVLVAAFARAQPTVVLDEAFADGERLTDAPPGSARWHYAGGGDNSRLAVAGGALVYTVPAGAANSPNFSLGYLGAPGRGITLGEGDTLTVSFTARFSAVNSFANGFRVGLFNSKGARIATDPAGVAPAPISGALYDGHTGYQFVVNPGGTAAEIAIARRAARSDGGILFTGQANIAGAANATAFTPAPGAATPVSISFSVGGGWLNMNFSFNGATLSRSDNMPFNSFDTLAFFGASGLLGSGQSLALDDIRVVHTRGAAAAGDYASHALTDRQGLNALFITPTREPEPGRVYTVLLGVHGVVTDDWNGDGTTGNAGDYEVVARGAAQEFRPLLITNPNLIALGVPFQPGTNRGSYQFASDFYCENVFELLDRIEAEGWPLRRRILVNGFSGGAQFAHRFALRFPDRVFAAGVHAPGSVETNPDPAARGVDFFISCGEADTSRLGNASSLANALASRGFRVSHFTWPGVGHDTAYNEIAPTVLRDGLGLTDGGRRTLADTLPNVRAMLGMSDPDRDGLPTLLEHALGTDPFAADAAGPQVASEGGRLRIEFSRPAGQPKLRVLVEGSEDLASWTTLAASDGAGVLRAQAEGVEIEESGAGPIRSVLRDAAGGARRFLRLRAEWAGAGARATFFPNPDLAGAPVVTRVEAISGSWGQNRPTSRVPVDGFSARWEAVLSAPADGDYVFRTRTDDGVRFWLDEELLIDRWTAKGFSQDVAPARALRAGRAHRVRLEFFDNTGNAEARLEWRPPGASGFVTVPVSVLSPP